MPVRKIPRSASSITGLIVTEDKQEVRAYESSLERDLMEILWFDRNVLRFEEQPIEIKFLGKDSKLRKYTPDILVVYRSDKDAAKYKRPMLCEVKYRQDLFRQWKELKPKFRAARAYAKERGWVFKIWTEVEIRTPYLYNIKFLRQYRKIPINIDQIELLQATLLELQNANPNTLLQSINKDKVQRAMFIPMIWYLISIGRIGANLTEKLTMSSHIWLIKEE